MTREEVNGPRRIQHGNIGDARFVTFEEAREFRDLVQGSNPHNTYEITGVAGDYRIIERDNEPTESRYL